MADDGLDGGSDGADGWALMSTHAAAVSEVAERGADGDPSDAAQGAGVGITGHTHVSDNALDAALRAVEELLTSPGVYTRLMARR